MIMMMMIMAAGEVSSLEKGVGRDDTWRAQTAGTERMITR